jgi:hypothetical protein
MTDRVEDETKAAAEGKLLVVYVPPDELGRLRVVADHYGVSQAEAVRRFGLPAVGRECVRVLARTGAAFDLGGEGG